MKNYKTPLSVGRYGYLDKNLGVIPLIAGAVGAVAGKALAAAVVGGAAVAGGKAVSKLVGDDKYISINTPNMKVMKLIKEPV